MEIKTSISLLVSEGGRLKCDTHNIVLNLNINHPYLKEIYSLTNPRIEADITGLIVNRKFDVDDDPCPNPTEKPLILFPVAEFELCDTIYHVLLFGQYYADYIVVSETNDVMTIDQDLTEAISDELANRSVKFKHQNFTISFFSFMQNYAEHYIRDYAFEEYLNLPDVAEESFYLDIAAY